MKCAPRRAIGIGSPAVDPRFVNGPLAVVDFAEGRLAAYCPGA